MNKGEILDQKEVSVVAIGTGKPFYAKLEESSTPLIEDVFPRLMTKDISTFPMPEGGKLNFAHEFEKPCSISEEKTAGVDLFLRCLYALSFPFYKNGFVFAEGKRIYVDVALREENGKTSS
ncbi:MAG: hypothetical protein Q7J27_04700 [Syntrophales bacterium]|nr:hypothetical protein [Syntrophales bacterium]